MTITNAGSFKLQRRVDCSGILSVQAVYHPRQATYISLYRVITGSELEPA